MKDETVSRRMGVNSDSRSTILCKLIIIARLGGSDRNRLQINILEQVWRGFCLVGKIIPGLLVRSLGYSQSSIPK
jgi:hypothetical protein